MRSCVVQPLFACPVFASVAWFFATFGSLGRGEEVAVAILNLTFFLRLLLSELPKALLVSAPSCLCSPCSWFSTSTERLMSTAFSCLWLSLRAVTAVGHSVCPGPLNPPKRRAINLLGGARPVEKTGLVSSLQQCSDCALWPRRATLLLTRSRWNTI